MQQVQGVFNNVVTGTMGQASQVLRVFTDLNDSLEQ